MAYPTMVPFVKWVGGKRQLLPELIKRLPPLYDTYYEPFIGAGALLLHLKPSQAVIGDVNRELITTYQVIKTRLEQLVTQLSWLELAHNEAFFKNVRELDRNVNSDRQSLLFQNSVAKAARFIYLNKASFNGIYRVNANGHYNTPSANRVAVRLFDLANVQNVAKYLKTAHVKILNRDFATQLKHAKRGDFVYLDPPYDYETNKASFDAFDAAKFGREGQVRLATLCHDLDARGVQFLLSNHNTSFVRQAYAKFTIEVIKAPRLVGGLASRRSAVEEVLIRNYEVSF